MSILTSSFYRFFQYITNGSGELFGEVEFIISPAILLDTIISIILACIIILIVKKIKTKVYPKEWLLVTLFFFLSFLFRIIFLGNGFFHHDSLGLVKALEDALQGDFHGTVGGRYGVVLVYLLFYIPFKTFFQVDTLLNLVNALFASLAISVFYLFAKHLLIRKTAVTATVLLAVSPILLKFTTFENNHGISLFFSLLSALLLVRALKTDLIRDKVWFSITFGFIFSIRLTNFFYIIPFFCLFFFRNELLNIKWKRKKQDLYYLLWIPLLIGELILNYKIHTVAYNLQPRIVSLLLNKLYYSSAFLVQSITVIGFVLLLYALWRLLRAKKYLSLIFYLSWILVPFFFYGTLVNVATRYFIIILIPLALLIAQGIELLPWKFLQRVLLISIIFSSIVLMYPILDIRHEIGGQKLSASYFGDNMPHSVIIAGDHNAFYEYYAGAQILLYPHEDVEQIKQFLIDVTYLLDLNVSVYTTKTMYGVFQRMGEEGFGNTLQHNFNLIHEQGVLTEDYHITDSYLYIYQEDFIRLEKKLDLKDMQIFT